MKKLLIGLSAFLLFSPLHVFAAESGLSDTALGNTLPIWSCIPFAGMLLSIAIFPLIKEEWWEKHKPWVRCILVFAVPHSFCHRFWRACRFRTSDRGYTGRLSHFYCPFIWSFLCCR